MVTLDQGSDQAAKIEPWLKNQLKGATGPTEMLVVLNGEADLSPAAGISGRSERGRFVYGALVGASRSTQPAVIAWLKGKGIEIEQRFWIVNAILIRGDLETARSLAALPGVSRIVGNPLVKGLPSVDASAVSAVLACPASDSLAVQGGIGLHPWAMEAGGAMNDPYRSDIPKWSSTVRSAVEDPLGTGSVTVRRQGGLLPLASSVALAGSSTRMVAAADGEKSPADGDEQTVAEQQKQPGSLAVTSAFGSTETIEWGVVMVNANSVWSTLGVKGEGIVVASMDTGVDWTHAAIQAKYRGWNNGNPDHSYSWHDPIQHTLEPLDDYGHGTHTVGTMVGDDGAGNQIGVAPGARWIGCRNMDHGNGTPATYLECMQWGLAPYREGSDPFVDGRPDLAADITNNSWTCPPSEGCDPLTLQQAFDNIKAAGQMTIAAAGNSGSSCSTVRDPPALYNSVFSAGAVSSTRTLAEFSSRGPVMIDGSSRLKPNVAAPGVSVRSCVPGGSYGSSSGTSMASPHTAGAMALLWSAKPNLKRLIRISRCYLERSAGPGAGTPATCGGTPSTLLPNNMWGWGIVDALAAIQLGPDSDGDGIANACDCAPANGGSFEEPSVVEGDRLGSDHQTYSWAAQTLLAGNGTTYDVARGLVSQLRADGSFAGASCISTVQSSTDLADTMSPPPGDAFYYLARALNACGDGGWGIRTDGTPRVVSGCP